MQNVRTATRVGAATVAAAAVALGGLAATTASAPEAQAKSSGIVKGMHVDKAANVKVKSKTSKYNYKPGSVRLAKGHKLVNRKVSVKQWSPKVKSWIATNKSSVKLKPGHYWVVTTVKYKAKGSSKIRTARQADGAWVSVKPAKKVATVSSSRVKMWDRVAKCESGGNWKINTGNGYYGGLQFAAGTWRGYGGGKFGSTANKATKAEQIVIAEKVLKGQGAGAWGGCGRKAGLRR